MGWETSVKLPAKGDAGVGAKWKATGKDKKLTSFSGGKYGPSTNPQKEELEIFEGRMKELHMYIQQGKSAKEIAKLMKLDVKTIKALMSEAWEAGTDKYRAYLERLTPGEMSYLPSENDPNNPRTYDPNQPIDIDGAKPYVKQKPDGTWCVYDSEGNIVSEHESEDEAKSALSSMNEASARADAMRSMKSDPSMKQNPFLTDVQASDEDIKGASKNIIMQMRKAVSLRGTHPVEFLDKKKVKIPVKIAQAVQDKYNTFRKPADKAKFQARVAKSHKDMLLALKENVEVKSFRDSVLDRVDAWRYEKDKSNG